MLPEYSGAYPYCTHGNRKNKILYNPMKMKEKAGFGRIPGKKEGSQQISERKALLMRKMALLGLVLVAGAVGIVGCSRSDSLEESNAAAPSSDQKLIVYTAHKEEVYRPIIEEFENQTGIWVDVQAGGTTEMLRRIREEEDSRTSGKAQADIMFGGGAENLETFKDYFESYYSPEEDHLDPAFVSADGSWTPFTELPIVFIYNNKLVPEGNAPRSWKEFIDGTWAGQISFADPEKSGTSITILETLKLVNEDQNWGLSDDELLKDLAENMDGHMAEGSGNVITEVASGERTVGITLEETALKEMARGRDISMEYPIEGTSAVPDGIAIIKDAPNPDNAQQFVDFVIDLPVQKYVETNLYRRSVRTDVQETVRGTDELKQEDVGELRILSFDVTAASGEERGVLEKFLQYFTEIEGE